jgi:hypothetical protein
MLPMKEDAKDTHPTQIVHKSLKCHVFRCDSSTYSWWAKPPARTLRQYDASSPRVLHARVEETDRVVGMLRSKVARAPARM